MKSISIRLLAFLLVGLMGLSTMQAHAGDKQRRGTSGATYLLVPPTARTASLASTLTQGIGDMNGLEALYSNPAGLTSNQGTGVLFSRMNYVADIGVNYLGLAQKLGNNQIALTVNSWNFGDISKQVEAAPETSSVTYSATFITVGLSFARQFTDRIAAGVTAKVVSESIDDVSASAMAFDAGMTYVVGESGLRLGVSVNNIGTGLQYSGTGLVQQVQLPQQAGNATSNAVAIESESTVLPSMLNFGVSYTRELGAGAVLSVLGNFRSNSFEQDQYAAGLEVALFDILYLRGGYELMSDADLSFYNGGNFGAGLKLSLGSTRLDVDYAYRATDYFKAVQMISASLTL